MQFLTKTLYLKSYFNGGLFRKMLPNPSRVFSKFRQKTKSFQRNLLGKENNWRIVKLCIQCSRFQLHSTSVLQVQVDRTKHGCVLNDPCLKLLYKIVIIAFFLHKVYRDGLCGLLIRRLIDQLLADRFFCNLEITGPNRTRNI